VRCRERVCLPSDDPFIPIIARSMRVRGLKGIRETQRGHIAARKGAREMSRLLRKGAIIGKATLATIVAGLLLYAAASLLRAEMAGETNTSTIVAPSKAGAQQAAAYRTFAEAEITAGNVESAYDAANEMMAMVSPGAETAVAAERIAKGMVSKGEWQKARELYGYSAKYAQGDTLKAALCGVARSEAEKGGDAQAAVVAAKAVAVYCQTDEKVTKILMQAGEKLIKNRKKHQACEVYQAVADNAPVGWEGMKAVRALGVNTAKLQDAASATAAAERLMRDDYRSVTGWEKAVDQIASQLSEQQMPDKAIAIYREMGAGGSEDTTARTALCGMAATLILNGRGDEASGYLAQLASPGGEITDAAICGKLGEAYIGAMQYGKAISCFQKVVAADKVTDVGWGATGKIVECAIRIGDDELAMASMDKMAGEYVKRADKGRTFFDYARRFMIGGRPEQASGVVTRYSGSLGREDAAWMEAAEVAMAAMKGSEPNVLISQIVTRVGDKQAPAMLYEVGRALLYRGIEIEVRDADAKRLFAASDEFLKYVTANYPDFNFLASTWHKRANCASYIGDYGGALECAGKAIEADPSYEYAGHCYIIIVESNHAIGRSAPSMKGVARTEVLKACQAAREACPDEKMVVDFVTACERVYASTEMAGGGI
jgi:tetratricopeptide (TPR) repeat protein